MCSLAIEKLGMRLSRHPVLNADSTASISLLSLPFLPLAVECTLPDLRYFLIRPRITQLVLFVGAINSISQIQSRYQSEHTCELFSMPIHFSYLIISTQQKQSSLSHVPVPSYHTPENPPFTISSEGRSRAVFSEEGKGLHRIIQ
jgi:hypothetical protein